MIAELLLNTIDRQSKPAVIFKPEKCLRSRLNTNSCDTCLNHCKSKAVALDGKKIVFNEDRCTGCMGCVSECPNDAFSIEFDIQTLLQSLIGNDSHPPQTISCQKGAPKMDGISVPCIGLLSEPVLAGMNCVASSDFYLDVQACPDCENGHVLNLLYQRIQKITAKLGGLEGIKIRYQTGPHDRSEQPGGQRRAFLSLTRKSLIKIGKEASSTLIPETETKQKIQDKRLEKDAVQISRFLQEILSRLPEDDVLEKNLIHSYFYSSKTSDKCDLCPLCTGMCPTGALKRKTDGDSKQLNFISAKCSGCGLCVEFCKKDALTIVPGVESDPAAIEAIA